MNWSAVPSLVVREGDTLDSLAKRYGRGANDWRALVRANTQRGRTLLGTFRDPLIVGERLALPFEWRDEAGDAPALPYGWDDDALYGVIAIARALGFTPAELMGVWFGESGLQPYLVTADAYGLAQIIPKWVEDPTPGAIWPSGTVKRITTEPIIYQLGLLYELYKRMGEKYLGESFATRAAKLDVTPGGLLYAFNFTPTRASKATSADSILTSAGETEYETPPNSNLDTDKDGHITVREMDDRQKSKEKEARNATITAPLFTRVDELQQPPHVIPGVDVIFTPVASALKEALNGRTPDVMASPYERVSYEEKEEREPASGLPVVIALGVILAGLAGGRKHARR